MTDRDREGGRRGDDDPAVAERRLEPEDAFGLLGHETRFRILEALNDADGPQSFSALRDRVGVRDSGQFNYHLGKLVDRFVRDGDDGYELTVPGRRIVGAVLSGGYTERLEGDAVEMDATCLRCGAPMETRFDGDRLAVDCVDCDFRFSNPPVPAGTLEGRSREEAPAVVDGWLKRQQWTHEHGFCPNCDGPVDRTLLVAGDDDAPEWIGEDDEIDAFVRVECIRCDQGTTSAVEATVLTHPAVVAFHYEHGIDLRKTPLWDLPWLDPGITSVTSRDPVRIGIAVTLGDETLELVFDRELSLVEERRT